MNFKLWLENADEDYRLFGDPKEWHMGQLAIHDIHFPDIAVVRVVDFEDVANGGENFEIIDKNTVYLHNPFGGMENKRGESVPIKVIDHFGFHAERYSQIENGFHYVGAQNLYRTIDALIRKKNYLVPDVMVNYWRSPEYHRLVTKYPTLKEKGSFLDEIEYHTFEVRGYTVMVYADPMHKKTAEEYQKHGYPHTPYYYFTIPELKTGSRYMEKFLREPENIKWLTQNNLSDSGLFKTIQQAVEFAERYIDRLFY